MITEATKVAIQERLAEYCLAKGSQNKAANTMQGVSSTVISRILSGEWQLIADNMWRTVAGYVGYETNEWQVVATRAYTRLNTVLTDAKDNSLVFAVTGDAGCGKSETIKNFSKSHFNVFVLSCNEYWNRKMFVASLMRACGMDSSGSTVGEMVQDCISEIKRRENPIIILDEADKLSDQVLYFFITIYNQLEDQCGIVLCATDYLEKRIKKGIRTNRKGYKEIYSRIGKKFIQLQVVNYSDVKAVCEANGISDSKVIHTIHDDCDCDLRRVKRLIHAYKKSQSDESTDE